MRVIRQKHSKNYNLRPNGLKSIRYIIIHYTDMNFEDSIERLCSPKHEVSSHYLINKAGDIYGLVGDFYRAWHAGESKWKNDISLNDYSIGIELESLAQEKFTYEQIESLLKLLRHLTNKYNIPADNILGHSDVAPSRKTDPGLYFNWQYLTSKGFGIKMPLYIADETQYQPIELTTSSIKKIQTKLKTLGYAIEITGSLDILTNHVIRAFQLHFNQNYLLFKGGMNYVLNTQQFDWDKSSDIILSQLILNI